MPKVKDKEDRSFLLARADFGSTYLYAGTFHLGLEGDSENQAQQIKDELYNNGYSDKKLIIGGDLNDKEGSSDTYNKMLWNVFPMADTGPGGVCTNNCWPDAPGKPRKIDFWFKRGLANRRRKE
ncbi:endonuclease/exonuclease/phosphatase family protein [Desulfoscipio gibsoniae]|uniref:endonuclease/exonuclease/phosphatase family protein n=1 Tax=Desulfoscipio gibsoniae TaxID=102134 RepID=UPI00059DD20A|nr:endonuclease/exonuclease/phosphatase family protein [Desulfoscipio gibsoniae]